MTDKSLLLSKIGGRLHELFDGRISMVEFADKTAEHQEPLFLSRALAALSLTQAADLTPDQAAACVTDSGTDDGIDAVYVDEKRKLVFFVQSKWITGTRSIKVAEVLRFRDGVNKIISLKWDSDNAALHPFRTKIETALSDISTNVALVIVHTSETPMSGITIKKLTDFVAEQTLLSTRNSHSPRSCKLRAR